MIIKKLTLEEVELVKTFMLNVIHDEFGYEFNPLWHSDIAELEKFYLNENSSFFVAVEQENIIGTIGVRPYDKNYKQFAGRYSGENTLSVWRHYVRKDKRGKGIGKLLYQHVEAFALNKNYQKIYLHTQKTIPGSLEYWMARGFVVVEDSKDGFRTVHLEKVL